MERIYAAWHGAPLSQALNMGIFPTGWVPGSTLLHKMRARVQAKRLVKLAAPCLVRAAHRPRLVSWAQIKAETEQARRVSEQEQWEADFERQRKQEQAEIQRAAENLAGQTGMQVFTCHAYLTTAARMGFNMGQIERLSHPPLPALDFAQAFRWRPVLKAPSWRKPTLRNTHPKTAQSLLI